MWITSTRSTVLCESARLKPAFVNKYLRGGITNVLTVEKRWVSLERSITYVPSPKVERQKYRILWRVAYPATPEKVPVIGPSGSGCRSSGSRTWRMRFDGGVVSDAGGAGEANPSTRRTSLPSSNLQHIYRFRLCICGSRCGRLRIEVVRW